VRISGGSRSNGDFAFAIVLGKVSSTPMTQSYHFNHLHVLQMFWRLPEDKTTSIAALLVAGESFLSDSFAEPRLLPHTLLDCESHASAPLGAGLAQACLLPRAFSDRASCCRFLRRG
jgi:hypothetical protein